MIKYFIIFLILTPLTAICLHRWAVFFVKSIQHISKKLNKKLRGFVFVPFSLIAVISMFLPLFLSLVIIFWIFSEDKSNVWIRTIVLMINWLISFIPAITHINRNKDKIIEAGYWQDTPHKAGIARIIIGIAGFVTGIAFMIACLFFIVFISNDYPTACDYIVEGGPIPEGVFEIGVFVVAISVAIGIPTGMSLWTAIFNKLGLLPRDTDA